MARKQPLIVGPLGYTIGDPGSAEEFVVHALGDPAP
jgi:hypothetical protein